MVAKVIKVPKRNGGRKHSESARVGGIVDFTSCVLKVLRNNFRSLVDMKPCVFYIHTLYNYEIITTSPIEKPFSARILIVKMKFSIFPD